MRMSLYSGYLYLSFINWMILYSKPQSQTLFEIDILSQSNSKNILPAPTTSAWYQSRLALPLASVTAWLSNYQEQQNALSLL